MAAAFPADASVRRAANAMSSKYSGENRRLALPRGMPTMFEINGLAEKWDSFRPMTFQGFSKQCPTDSNVWFDSPRGIEPASTSLMRPGLARCPVAPHLGKTHRQRDGDGVRLCRGVLRLGPHSGFSLSISAFASAVAFSMAPFRVMGRPKALSSRERQAYLMPLVKKRPQARVQAPGPQLAPE